MIKITGKDKLHRVLVSLFRLLLIGAIIGNVLTQNWLNLFTSLLTLLLTYLPFLLAEKNHIYLPSGFQIIILLFIFASLYLGELKEYYLKFWWWDLMLHTLSGIILGFIGFVLVYFFSQEDEINVILSPLFITIFSFTFALSVGVLWEIFEFSMDSLLNLNMQKSGLVDTMWDLIVDSIGALVTSIIGYLYIKKEGPTYFKELVHQITDKHISKK
ncbi:membrane protein [Halanaerocella petrolearia]